MLRMFERHFCFAYISTWENDTILNSFLKDVPSKALQKAVRTNSYNESEKSVKHFQYDGRWHCHVGCPF